MKTFKYLSLCWKPLWTKAQKTKGPSDAEAAKIDEVSDIFTDYLHKLWIHFLKYGVKDEQKLSLKDIVNLGITYGSLDIDGMDSDEVRKNIISLCASSDDDDSEFFRPMDLEKFNTYSIDMESEFTREYAKDYLCSWVDTVSECGEETEYDIDTAAELCTLLEVGFGSLRMKSRENTEGSKFFEHLTVWRPFLNLADLLGYEDWDVSLFWETRYDTSTPRAVWVAEDKPHMMVAIANEYEGDDDSLLVNEIRVIIALMNDRLINDSFRDENIVPIQAFSFTRNRQGRILQAYMNDNGLVIRRSRLFAFSGTHDAHYYLFLRHMVCSLQGSTRTLRAPQIKYDFA